MEREPDSFAAARRWLHQALLRTPGGPGRGLRFSEIAEAMDTFADLDRAFEAMFGLTSPYQPDGSIVERLGVRRPGRSASEFGDRLRRARDAAGFAAKEVYAKVRELDSGIGIAGLSESAISHYEAGRRRPRPRLLRAMLLAYGVAHEEAVIIVEAAANALEVPEPQGEQAQVRELYGVWVFLWRGHAGGRSAVEKFRLWETWAHQTSA